MPTRKPTAAEIISALLHRAGQGVGGYYQLKAAQEGQDAKQTQKDAEMQAWLDFFKSRQTNPMNVASDVGVPMFGRTGKPTGVAVESGAYERFQRPKDVALLDAYTAMGATRPEWLKKRAEQAYTPAPATIPALDILKHKAEMAKARMDIAKENEPEKPAALTDREKYAGLKWRATSGEPLNPMEKILLDSYEKTYGTDKNIQADLDKYKKDMANWNEKIRNYIRQNKESLPKTMDLIDTFGVWSINREQAPPKWSQKDWSEYTREMNKIRNLTPPRPTLTVTPEKEDPVVEALKAKGYTDEEIKAAME